MSTNERKPVLVTRKVRDEIMEIRRVGKPNMFDLRSVLEVADFMDCHHAAEFIRENTSEYRRGISCGFELLPWEREATSGGQGAPQAVEPSYESWEELHAEK